MKTGNLSLLALTGLVIGSMVGAGIFSLPRTFGIATGPIGALIAWSIAGGGMFALAYVFRILAEERPDLDSGIYAYAKEGFGSYAGFLAAFGYWLVGCIADVSYWVLIKSTLGRFFPVFGDGNTVTAVAVSSVFLWIFHFLVMRGIKQATFINTVVTFAKIIPIIIFILIIATVWNNDIFKANLWGGDDLPATSLWRQVSATMMVTVFVFIGIEGASVYSRYAKQRQHVGIATIVGFAVVLALMVLVTLLPYAMMPRAEIAMLRQPSMAAVFEVATGHWGAVFISAGLILSVLGAYLAWSLICIEVPYTAAKNGDMPRFFTKENANGVPIAALWLTNIIIQLFLISTIWSDDAFKLLLGLTSTMSLIPYLLVALFGLQIARTQKNSSIAASTGLVFLIASAVATLYAFFLVYAVGLKLLLLSLTLYAPSSALYIWTRKEQGRKVFNQWEMIIFLLVSAGGILAFIALITGMVTT